MGFHCITISLLKKKKKITLSYPHTCASLQQHTLLFSITADFLGSW